MPTIASAALREHRAGDAVQPGDVGDRGHHHDVGDADVGRDVAGGERRDHQLRHAERQRAHAGGDDRGAAAAADADDRGDVVARAREGGRRPRPCRRRRCRGRRAPRTARRRRDDVPATSAAPTSTATVAAPGADVDRARRATGLGHAAREEGELLALGVRGADDVDVNAMLCVRSPPRAHQAPRGGVGFLPVCRVAPGSSCSARPLPDGRRELDCFPLRRPYRIDMDVSGQAEPQPDARETGPRARTRRLLLDTAMTLMQAGRVPSVTDVAEAAEVSRATAYRYFPTQAALVQAAVDEALGPILAGTPIRPTPRSGSRSCSASPIRASTSTRRRSARRCCMAMDQWSRRRAGHARRRGADRARQPPGAARQRAGAAQRRARRRRSSTGCGRRCR